MKITANNSQQRGPNLSGVAAESLGAGLVVLVLIALFVFPIPSQLLDILLVTNIVVALILLLRSMVMKNALSISLFPRIVLLTTLFRLGLNVASTRLILLNGDKGLDAAGRVIEAFGSFVVQGDFFVGAIIFGVITIVNFIVITKGAARVAEVAARFALDALPGRQLAIDADLRTGNITRDEAARLREVLKQESQFYGAMDGSMRFVQGDAFAGLLITFINSIGGISLGLSRGMSFSEAINVYGILTIGDGLVTILPALLISVCAGIVVTYVSREATLQREGEFFRQLVSEPQAIALAATTLLLIGFIPGFPKLPFLFVAAGVFFSLYFLNRKYSRELGKQKGFGPLLLTIQESSLVPTTSAEKALEKISQLFLPAPSREVQSEESKFELERVEIEVDSSLIMPYLQEYCANANWYVSMQQPLAEDFFQRTGLIFPEIQFRSNATLSSGEYRVKVRRNTVRSGHLDPSRLFVASQSSVLNLLGIQHSLVIRHPVTERTLFSVDRTEPALVALRQTGDDIFGAEEFLVLEAAGAIFEVIDQFVGFDSTQKLLDALRRTNPTLVASVVGAQGLSTAELVHILRELIVDNVSIADLRLVLEGLGEYLALHPRAEDSEKWRQDLLNFLRRFLKRAIFASLSEHQKPCRAFLLSEDLVEEFRETMTNWSQARTRPPFDPVLETKLRAQSLRRFSAFFDLGNLPIVLLCDQDIRLVVRDVFRSFYRGAEWLRVVAYEELDDRTSLETVGVIELP